MIRQTAYLSNKGVTLVEVMISLVILLIVFMGLIQASLLSINSNLRNEIRDGVVKIVAENMSNARSTDFATLTTGAAVCPSPIPAAVAAPGAPYPFSTAGAVPTRVVRNYTLTYNVWRSVCFTDASNSAAWVSIIVDYRYPDETTNSNRQASTGVVKR